MSPASEMALQLKSIGFPAVPEYKFHPSRKWRFDFAYPLNKLAIEVHGGIYRQGRHTRGKGFENDREKMNEAQIMGWTVLEVTPRQIKTGAALEWVERFLGVDNAPSRPKA